MKWSTGRLKEKMKEKERGFWPPKAKIGRGGIQRGKE